MKWSVLVLALGTCGAVAAQVLVVEADADDPQRLVFNGMFMARNGVLSITGQASVKREGQPMREKNEHCVYTFDGQGRTISSDRSFARGGGLRDTTCTHYTYDTAGRSTEEVRKDLNGWFVLHDSLDEKGRCTRRTHIRIDAPRDADPQALSGAETLISDEHFTYVQEQDSILRCTWHNERGLPYREQRFHRDEWGYLRTIDDRNLVTGKRGRITLRYDEKGRVAERIEQSDLSKPDRTKHVWRYDRAGNITTCDAWQGDRPTRHSEYLYEEGTLFLKATLAKDLETGLIHIWRFSTARR